MPEGACAVTEYNFPWKIHLLHNTLSNQNVIWYFRDTSYNSWPKVRCHPEQDCLSRQRGFASPQSAHSSYSRSGWSQNLRSPAGTTAENIFLSGSHQIKILSAVVPAGLRTKDRQLVMWSHYLLRLLFRSGSKLRKFLPHTSGHDPLSANQKKPRGVRC